MDTNDDANWREKGVTNWARDIGFDMTQKDGRYTMWSVHPPKIVLDQARLDEVEHYLSRREVASQLPVMESGDLRLRKKRRPRCKRRLMLSLLIGVIEILEHSDERSPTPVTALAAPNLEYRVGSIVAAPFSAI
jgi:hypothetical protein